MVLNGVRDAWVKRKEIRLLLFDIPEKNNFEDFLQFFPILQDP